MTNIDTFLAAVEEDAAFKPFGEKLSQYRREEEVYEVFKVSCAQSIVVSWPTLNSAFMKLKVSKFFEKIPT